MNMIIALHPHRTHIYDKSRVYVYNSNRCSRLRLYVVLCGDAGLGSRAACNEAPRGEMRTVSLVADGGRLRVTIYKVRLECARL